MTTWAIGDLQGCADDFERLLAQIRFSVDRDTLWLVGDLVSRGPASLRTLRMVYERRENVRCVLGNHDLHLLAQAAGAAPKQRSDLGAIIDAADGDKLLRWLRHQPLIHRNVQLRFAMVHAGLPPQWTLDQAVEEADAVAQALQAPDSAVFLHAMYGDQPNAWRAEWADTPASSTDADRLRFAVNCLTRLRVCTPAGQLLLSAKGGPHDAPDGGIPWFAVPGRASAGERIVFGHWSTLGQVHWPEHSVSGLDTGCVWGGALTALSLDTGELVSTPCPLHRQPK